MSGRALLTTHGLDKLDYKLIDLTGAWQVEVAAVAAARKEKQKAIHIGCILICCRSSRSHIRSMRTVEAAAVATAAAEKKKKKTA